MMVMELRYVSSRLFRENPFANIFPHDSSSTLHKHRNPQNQAKINNDVNHNFNEPTSKGLKDFII